MRFLAFLVLRWVTPAARQRRPLTSKLKRVKRATAERVIARVDKSGAWKKPVVTELVPASTWYDAEDYHQDYLKKNPGGYTCHYVRKVDF